MVHKRRDFLITFTVLCLAMCACSGLQYLGSAFYLMVRHWVFSLESGGVVCSPGSFVPVDRSPRAVCLQHRTSVLAVIPTDLVSAVRPETGPETFGGSMGFCAVHGAGTRLYL